jgi:hypothetical protein
LPPRRRRGGVLAAVGTIGVVGAVAITVKVRSSGSEVPQPPPPAPADAAELAVIVDAQPSLRERIEARNPFVTVRTFMNQTRQVQSRVTTNEELAMYLASLPEDVRAKSGPLAEVADPSPNGAAVGMTYERARAFCLAIGADLPATEIWKRSPNHENWQEWTATVQDGLVTVMGTHPQMTPVERTQALAEPLLKATEASAGPGAAAAVIADKHITFRCAR